MFTGAARDQTIAQETDDTLVFVAGDMMTGELVGASRTSNVLQPTVSRGTPLQAALHAPLFDDISGQYQLIGCHQHLHHLHRHQHQQQQFSQSCVATSHTSLYSAWFGWSLVDFHSSQRSSAAGNYIYLSCALYYRQPLSVTYLPDIPYALPVTLLQA